MVFLDVMNLRVGPTYDTSTYGTFFSLLEVN